MQCYIPNFKHMSKVILKKKIFEYFSMYFCGLKLGPLWRGHLGPCGLDLNKRGKRPLCNATYQISSIWAKWFWRRFFNIFMHFYGSNLRPPGEWQSLTLRPLFEHLSQAVLEKKTFKYISFLSPPPTRAYVAGSFWTPGPPSKQIC